MTADNFVIYPDDVVPVFIAPGIDTGQYSVPVILINGPQGNTGPEGPAGAGAEFYNGVLNTALQDGITSLFPLPQEARDPAKIQVFRNGLLEIPGLSFSATETEIYFFDPPLDTDVISLSYQL